MIKYCLFLVLFFTPVVFSAPPPVEKQNPDKETTVLTQGEFAVLLLNSLDHNKHRYTPDSAIKSLSSSGIIPRIMPGDKWEKDKRVTSRFVSLIQASIQKLLARISRDSGIIPPPTLTLAIFEVEPAPQTIYFPKEEQQSRASASLAPPPPTLTDEILSKITNPASLPSIIGGGLPESYNPIPESRHENMVKIDNKIISALKTQAEVPVIIQLSVESSNDIASVQSSFIDSILSTEFKVTRKFSSIPSLAGWITSNGIEKFHNNPAIHSIQLDAIDKAQ